MSTPFLPMASSAQPLPGQSHSYLPPPPNPHPSLLPLQNHSLPPNDTPSGAPITISSKLKQEEQRIDLKVLHHLNRDDHRKKQKRFKRTVMAVHAIVSHKLYKSKASSLEAYFRDAWKISRAQVYRFLDCAVVLKQLEGFTEQPCRERLCRSLKRLAKNRTDIQKLWETVLTKVNNDHEAVTSTIINTVWRELLELGTVTGRPAMSNEHIEVEADVGALSDIEMGAAAMDDDCDSDGRNDRAGSQVGRPEIAQQRGTLGDRTPATPLDTRPNQYARPYPGENADMSGTAMGPSTNAQNYISDSQGMRRDHDWRNQDVSWRSNRDVPTDLNYQESLNSDVAACTSLLDSVGRKGYALQPYLNGRWVKEPVSHWRFAPHYPSSSGRSEAYVFDVAHPGAPYGTQYSRPAWYSSDDKICYPSPSDAVPRSATLYGQSSTPSSRPLYEPTSATSPYENHPGWDHRRHSLPLNDAQSGTYDRFSAPVASTKYSPLQAPDPTHESWSGQYSSHGRPVESVPDNMGYRHQQPVIYDQTRTAGFDPTYNRPMHSEAESTRYLSGRNPVPPSYAPLTAPPQPTQHAHTLPPPTPSSYPTLPLPHSLNTTSSTPTRGHPLEPRPNGDSRSSANYFMSSGSQYGYGSAASLPPIMGTALGGAGAQASGNPMNGSRDAYDHSDAQAAAILTGVASGGRRSPLDAGQAAM
ncbi:hypothetical protein SpCBS45565_g00937 [Spizellomyces sp. 'palustris']|nr:hypothetical protein SpCBS45565_g00937 [Spizellomyces sp. 'palustris']